MEKTGKELCGYQLNDYWKNHKLLELVEPKEIEMNLQREFKKIIFYKIKSKKEFKVQMRKINIGEIGGFVDKSSVVNNSWVDNNSRVVDNSIVVNNSKVENSWVENSKYDNLHCVYGLIDNSKYDKLPTKDVK